MDPNIRVATDEFIRRSRKIHGDRYDYSFSIVEDSSSTVVIIDRETNTVFFQVVAEHLDGVEPITTAVEPVDRSGRFITRARKIHGDRYDYSLVEYVNARSCVKIICPTHGVFEQRPEVHLHQRSGCQQCAETGFNPSEPGTLYVLADDKQYPTLIKIGITNDLKKRLRCLRYSTPHPVVKLVSYLFPHGADAYKLEQEVHNVFHELNARLKGFDGATEWFKYSSEMLDYISNRYRGQSP